MEIDAPGSLPRVNADKDALMQVLVNLVGNAIKFSEKGGVISIRAEVGSNKQFLLISVQDTGMGIERKHLSRIFEKFYRVEAIAHDIPGTGLGLGICKELVEKHKGKIWAESEVGKGSTFHFTIPIFSNVKGYVKFVG